MVRLLFKGWFLVVLAAFPVLFPDNRPYVAKTAILTICKAESMNQWWLVGDHGKALGLMQIQKTTWQRFTPLPHWMAFIAPLNKWVGEKRVEEIQRKYHFKDPAQICWKYNCGDNSKLTFEKWKAIQPNRIYRGLYE